MNELEDSFAKLLGRQPTDSDRQQLYRVRDALGLKNNDALWLVLMALQHYESLYADIPDSIKQSAQKAAASAAGQAQAEVNRAVAALVPTVEDAVSHAATAAVNRTLNRVKLGQSIITTWLALIVVGIAFAIGWLFGGHVFVAAQTGSLKWPDFWETTGWGIAIGLAAPVFLILGMSVVNDDDYRWVGWSAVVSAFALAGCIFFKVWHLK